MAQIQPPTDPKPKPKSTEELLKDANDSLQFAQLFIKGLENLLGDIFPGWDAYDDDELPAVIQAFHLKYKRMEERSAAAEKSSGELREALEDRTRRGLDEKLRMTQRHGEAMAKLAAELEQAKKAGK